MWRIGWCVVLMVFVWPVAGATPARVQALEVPLTILYTTDLRGRLSDFTCRTKGKKASSVDASHLLALVREQRAGLSQKKLPAPLLFNTGDLLAPLHETRFLLANEGDRGAHFLAHTYREFGYDLMGLGDHDLSVSMAQLRRFLQQARHHHLPIAVTNLEPLPKKHPLQGLLNRMSSSPSRRSYFVFEREHKGVTLRVAVFHVTPETIRLSPTLREKLQFEDPIDKAKAIVKKIEAERPKIDLVIALSHLETKLTQGSAVRTFAEKVPGVDIIITNEFRGKKGYVRSMTLQPEPDREVRIFAGLQEGKMVGHIRIELEKKPGQQAEISAVKHTSLYPRMGLRHQSLHRALEDWQKRYCTTWGKPIGRGKITAKAGMSKEQFQTYLLNVMRWNTSADIAAIDPRQVSKWPFPLYGAITKSKLHRALVFDDKLVLFKLRGSDLEGWLKGSQEHPLEQLGWDVEEKKINGRKLLPEQLYRVITLASVAEAKRLQMIKAVRKRQSKQKALLKKEAKLKKNIASHQEDITKLLKQTQALPRGSKKRSASRKKLREAQIKHTTDTRTLGVVQKSLKKVKLQLEKAIRDRKAFDQTWQVLTHRSCTRAPTLRQSCREACCPHIRNMLLSHFAKDVYRRFPPIRVPVDKVSDGDDDDDDDDKPKQQRALRPDEIPFTGAFLKLDEHAVWTLLTSLQLAFDSNVIQPNDLIGLRAYSQIPTDYFNQIQFSGQADIQLSVNTKTHQWESQLQLQYGLYFRSRWQNSEKSAQETIADEADDLLRFQTRYRWQAWPRIAFFGQFELITEFTRRGRRDLDDDAFVRSLKQYRYRNFAIEASLGVEFQLVPDILKVALSVDWSKPFALEVFPDPAAAFGLFGEVGGFPDINHRLGFTARYELELPLFTIEDKKTIWTSQGSYTARFLVTPSTQQKDLLLVHDIVLKNAIGIQINRYLRFDVSLNVFIYKGTYQQTGQAGGDPRELNTRTSGPWSIWLIPMAGLKLIWGKRGQIL